MAEEAAYGWASSIAVYCLLIVVETLEKQMNQDPKEYYRKIMLDSGEIMVSVSTG